MGTRRRGVMKLSIRRPAFLLGQSNDLHNVCEGGIGSGWHENRICSEITISTFFIFIVTS